MYQHLTSDDAVSESKSTYMLGLDIDPMLINRCEKIEHLPSFITFKCCNIMDLADRENVINQFLKENCIEKFDVIFCFAVIMWIHLNHGDEGLRDFLQYISSIGVNLVIEEQSWKCYKNAQRRMKRLGCKDFEHIDSIRWRENVTGDILEYLTLKCGMKFVATFGVTAWDRKINMLTVNEENEK